MRRCFNQSETITTFKKVSAGYAGTSTVNGSDLISCFNKAVFPRRVYSRSNTNNDTDEKCLTVCGLESLIIVLY